MKKKFSDLTATDARQIVEAAVYPWMEINHKFITGDHFQNGAGWIGPGPVSGEDGYSEFTTLLEPAFISSNATGRAVQADVSAPLGHEPRWGMVPIEIEPKDEEKAQAFRDRWEPLQAESDALLTAWWDKRGIHSIMQDAGKIYRSEQRVLVRFFIPSDLRDANGEIASGKSLEEYLDALYLEAVRPQLGRVYTDRDAMAGLGIYLFTEEEDYVDPKDSQAKTRTVNKCELTWVESGKTILKIVGQENAEPSVFDLGGRLWHYQIEHDPLITEQVRSLQKLLNLALTTSKRNLADYGWLEEFLINFEMPGEFTEVPQSDGTSRRVFVPSNVSRGPGKTRNLISKVIEKTDPETNAVTQTAMPSEVIHRQPVDPTPTIDTVNAIKATIAEEVHQEHLINSGADGNASGESLKQQRANFIQNQGPHVANYNKLGRWIIETALAIAVALSKKPNPYEGLRCNFECRLDAGPLSSAEIQEIENLNEKGLLSDESAMVRTGYVDDPDAEMSRINNDGMAILEKRIKQVGLINALSTTFDAETAFRMAVPEGDWPEAEEMIAQMKSSSQTQPGGNENG